MLSADSLKGLPDEQCKLTLREIKWVLSWRSLVKQSVQPTAFVGQVKDMKAQSPELVPTGEPQPVAELALDEALAVAVQLHHRGRLHEAEIMYRRVLEIAPDHGDALHFLGVLSHQLDDSSAALDLIRRSIAIDPGHADRYNNLGNVLLESGQCEQAAAAYEKCVELAPDHAGALNNLGAVLRAQNRFAESEAAYRKASELQPDYADPHNNLGNLMRAQGRIAEAVACYCKALTLRPNHPEAKKFLGIAYYTLGQIDKAADVYRQWLSDEPDNPVPRHMLAACSGENLPPRASDAYVEKTFDSFAGSFDAKLERLAYRAPQLVAEAVQRACGMPTQRFTALDAGCGTGLCGVLIAPSVRRMTGVDLSSQMLAKARARNVYDDLVKAELTGYVLAHPESFDLIVSADTLVYFGPLEEVLGAARGALRGDGWLIFTVEAADDKDLDASCGYCLNPNGRYSHRQSYLSATIGSAGLALVVMEPAVLRNEGGKPVAGWVATCRAMAGRHELQASIHTDHA